MGQPLEPTRERRPRPLPRPLQREPQIDTLRTGSDSVEQAQVDLKRKQTVSFVAKMLLIAISFTVLLTKHQISCQTPTVLNPSQNPAQNPILVEQFVNALRMLASRNSQNSQAARPLQLSPNQMVSTPSIPVNLMAPFGSQTQASRRQNTGPNPAANSPQQQQQQQPSPQQTQAQPAAPFLKPLPSNNQPQMRPSIPISLANSRGPLQMNPNSNSNQNQNQNLNQRQPLNNRPMGLPMASVSSQSVSPSRVIGRPPDRIIRPVSGFAPSGPPPSNLAPNNALTVVPSPTNGAGPMQDQILPADSTRLNASTETTSPLEASMASTTVASSAGDSLAAEPSSPSQVQSQSGSSSEQPSSSPTSISTTSERPDVPASTVKDLWSPLENKTYSSNESQSTSSPKPILAPSPDIVTVPPGYNPDNPPTGPQNYDIAVSAQMGSPALKPLAASSSSSKPGVSLAVAPTAVTTIVWTPPSSSIPPQVISATTTLSQSESMMPSSVIANKPQQTMGSVPSLPTRIRDTQMGDSDQEVVYGKSQARESQPIGPSPVLSQATIESSVPAAGRPVIEPVEVDNQVRPYAGPSTSQQQATLAKRPFKSSRPASAPMNVGSGFTIVANGNQTMPTGDIQDYVADLPPILPVGSTGAGDGSTISAQGGQDPASFDLGAQETSRPSSIEPPPASNNSVQTPRLRRPVFKARPNPTVRIDSCIVGDDSSCEQSHNERCVTEYGISSCHCKPGYARLSQLRGFCHPISLLQLTLKIDKLADNRKLAYNQTLENPNTEEFQYLEFETVQALAGAFQQTSLAKQFMGAKVIKFFEKRGKVHVNVTLNFEHNNITKNERSIQSLAAQDLAKLSQSQSKPKTLGDSSIMIDGSKDTMSKLVDVNECASKDLNDCSKFANCTNEFGLFHCQCWPGYDDKFANEDKSKQGRVCLGCSASYCSNRGECLIQDGQKQCKCRANFMGARCDIDSEVLAVAVGGSLVGIVILVVTFWCLFVFNRRWKREQQKMDAISATSGHTYNYVNSSTNSLMSPTRYQLAGHAPAGGLHRSGGHHQAAAYGQRFVNTGRSGANNHLYPTDQQAIIGSTSSGSSAQSLHCNPYNSHQQHLHGAYQAALVAADEAGLLIAPASGASSEQTSPGSGNYNCNMLSQMAAGSAYTLSGHHHHHHLNQTQQLLHHQMLQQQQQQQLHHMTTAGKGAASQFHADYRTLNSSLQCMPNGDTRKLAMYYRGPY